MRIVGNVANIKYGRISKANWWTHDLVPLITFWYFERPFGPGKPSGKNALFSMKMGRFAESRVDMGP